MLLRRSVLLLWARSLNLEWHVCPLSAFLDRPFAIAVPEINVPIGVPLTKHRHARRVYYYAAIRGNETRQSPERRLNAPDILVALLSINGTSAGNRTKDRTRNAKWD
jgi:hypothetical protein